MPEFKKSTFLKILSKIGKCIKKRQLRRKAGAVVSVLMDLYQTKRATRKGRSNCRKMRNMEKKGGRFDCSGRGKHALPRPPIVKTEALIDFQGRVGLYHQPKYPLSQQRLERL